MKLEKWALIAEVAGSVAVVVTLVVLILQVQANTDLSRIEAYDSVTRDFDAWRRDVLGDPANLSLFHAYARGETPPEGSEDALKLGLLLTIQWSAHERAYYSHKEDIISGDRWERISESDCRQYSLLSAFPTSIREDFFSRLTAEFRQHIVQKCP